MTYKSNLIPPHGGYRKLKSFQNAEIVFDLTVIFCNSHLSDKSNKTYRSYRTYDQMVQAARSGSRNIQEGSVASGTSKKSELRLVSVARASLEELLGDYVAFLRQNNLNEWEKKDSQALAVRQLAYKADRSHTTYMPYMTDAESAANCLICLIHQTNYLLDQQLRSLEKELAGKGDLKERIREERKKAVLGNNFDYDDMIKKFGLKKLENGQVVKIDEDNK